MVGKWLGKIWGAILIIIGIGLFFYPDISEWIFRQQTTQYIDAFQTKYKENRMENSSQYDERKETEEAAAEFSSGIRNDPLYGEILTYNQEIYENGQAGFRDAWSYEQTPVSLDGLEDGQFGYVEIPVMDVILPLYIGASGSNMSKGAAILGQTSIPIGGKNTNSVIAAHRGWSTGSFLRDIEKVSIGDAIYITNPWEQLAYQVEAIDIVYPDNSDAVKIQEGRDMVTICTCHPYMSHGQYRYLLYCVRNENTEKLVEENSQIFVEETEEGMIVREKKQEENGCIIASNGNVYESSDNVIQTENLLRRGSALAIILIILQSFVYTRIRDRKKG